MTSTRSPIADILSNVSPVTAIVVVGLAIAALYLKQQADFNKRKSGAKLLPGPKGSFLLGNLRQLPAEKPWEKLKQWADEYGERR